MEGKSENSTVEGKNLILFPSSKNYPLDEETISDPLEDLLRDIPEYYGDETEETSTPSQRNLANHEPISEMKYRELFELVKDQLRTLKESNQRIKFYLDEIELDQ